MLKSFPLVNEVGHLLRRPEIEYGRFNLTKMPSA
jgi:hypothetical protein